MNKKNVDILVIGGSAAGMVAAVTAKTKHPNKEVLLIRKEEKAMVPCGIPYVYGTLGGTQNNVMPTTGMEKAGVDMAIDTVESVDAEAKVAKTKSGLTVTFDKLIMATGSQPVKPGWLEGADLEGVYTIPKDKPYLDDLKKVLKTKRKWSWSVPASSASKCRTSSRKAVST